MQAGEIIAEIEVDKATVDLESPEAGTLVRIVAPAGSGKVDVGQVLAVLDETWKVSVVRQNGHVENLGVRLSSLQSLTLSLEEGFERKRTMLSAVRQLASDTFEQLKRVKPGDCH